MSVEDKKEVSGAYNMISPSLSHFFYTFISLNALGKKVVWQRQCSIGGQS